MPNLNFNDIIILALKNVADEISMYIVEFAGYDPVRCCSVEDYT